VKSGVENGGIVKNIYLENINMTHIQNEAISFNTFYENRPAGYKAQKAEEIKEENIPDFNHFFFKNIYCYNARTAMNLAGGSGMPIRQLEFENIVISAEKGVVGSYIEDVSFEYVKIFNAVDPAFTFGDSKNITLDRCSVPATCEVFMTASGSGTSGITIKGTMLPKGDNVIQLSGEVDRNAVIIR
jgi:hypothetical protein